ncbi:MAG: hypothetical protein WBZ19_00510 [Chthoniobacterales bacterium]
MLSRSADEFGENFSFSYSSSSSILSVGSEAVADKNRAPGWFTKRREEQLFEDEYDGCGWQQVSFCINHPVFQ